MGWREDEVKAKHGDGAITASERGDFLRELAEAHGTAAKDRVIARLRRAVGDRTVDTGVDEW